MQAKTFLQLQAYEQIKNDILSGALQPEILYSESKMSAKLGISRTPVREALQCLSQDGYITVVPSKGFQIRQLNEKDMIESIQVRCAIEGFCTYRVSAELSSEKGQALLRDMHAAVVEMERVAQALAQAEAQLQAETKDENKRKDELESFIHYDHEFHLYLVKYVHNSEFDNLFQRLMYLIQLTSKSALSVPGRIEGTLREHQEYLRLLEAGKVEAAYKCMIDHLKMPLNMELP